MPAAAAGCSQRTFFRHFASKEDVVFDGLPERLSELAQFLDAVPADESAWAAVRDSLRQMTRQFTDEDPELSEVRIRLWMTEPMLYARWTEISLTWEREVARFLSTRRSGADEFDIDSEVVAAAVITALRAAWRGDSPTCNLASVTDARCLTVTALSCHAMPVPPALIVEA